MAEEEALFDHDEYFETMSYYYSKAVEHMSIPIAAQQLGVSISLIEEAVELKKSGALKEYYKKESE